MLGSSFWLMLSQIIVLAATPILARIYSVEDFSTFASFMAVFVIASSISGFRLTDYLVKCSDEQIKSVMGAINFSGFFVISFSSVVILLLFNVFYFFSIVLALVFFVATRSTYFLDVRSKKFSRASMWMAINNIALIVFQIVLSGYEAGLVYGLVFAQITVYILQLIFRKNEISYSFYFSGKDFNNYFFKMKSYTIFLTLYSLVSGARSKIIYLFLSGLPIAGVLAQFEKIANAPNTMISTVVRPVIFSTINSKDVNEKMECIIGGIYLSIFLLGIPFLCVIEKYSEWIVGFVFGDQWIAYEDIFFMVSVSCFFLLNINWMDRMYDIMFKQKINFIIELVAASIFLIVFASLYLMGYTEYLVYSYLILIALYSLIWLFFLYVAAGFRVKILFQRFSFGLFYSLFIFISFGFLESQSLSPLLDLLWFSVSIASSLMIVTKLKSWVWIKSHI